MSNRANQLYEFGPFVLNPAERTLQRDGRPVALQPKVLGRAEDCITDGPLAHTMQVENSTSAGGPNLA